MMLTLAQIVRRAEVRMDPIDYEMKISAVPTPGPADDFKVFVERLRPDTIAAAGKAPASAPA
jgi:hypothetical protein